MEPESEIVEDGPTRAELRAKIWEDVRSNPTDSVWITPAGTLCQATVDPDLNADATPKAQAD